MNQEDLMKLVSPVVTLTGHLPTEMTWRFTVEDVKRQVEMIMDPLGTKIDRSTQISIRLSDDGERAFAYFKIAKTDKNVCWKPTEETITKHTIFKPSQELTEIMNKFGIGNKIFDDEDGKSYDIPIDLGKMFKVLLDVGGEYAKTVTGEDTGVPYKNLTINVIKDRNEKRIKHIEVRKSMKIGVGKEPQPKKAFRY